MGKTGEIVVFLALFSFVWGMKRKCSGMDEATIEDLAFLNCSLRKSGEAGHRVCLNSGQWIQKTRNFCPSESKAARFQASLSQNRDCPYFVNHARSAFKRFFSPTALRLCFE